MRRITSLLVTVLLLSMGIMGVLAQGEETAQLRFVHVIPGATAIDVYTDGQLTVSNLDYGEASNYINVPAGTREITVTPRGVTTTLWQQQINANADQPQTLVASSTNPLQFDAFEDDFSPIALGTTRFKAIHAINDASGVDILAGEDAITSDLQYGGFIGTFDIPAEVYDLTVIPTGASADEALLSSPFSLVSNTSQMLVVYGTSRIPQVLLLSAPTLGDDNSGFVRLAHGVAGAPGVDVYVDDVLVAAGLEFGRYTEHLAIAADSYTVELRTAGTSNTLAEAELEVEAGTAVTLVAVGTGDDLSVQVVEDEIGGITAENALVVIINTIPDSSITVRLADGTVLADDLAFGETSPVTSIEPTEQAVSATLSVNGQSANLNLGTQTFYGGVFYSGLAFDGAMFTPPTVAFAATSLAQSLASAPGAGELLVATEPTTEPEVVEPTAVAEAPEPTEAPTLPPVVVTTPEPQFPTGRVLLDPGANLHLRQYPSSQALSLGLAPSGTILQVNGREGAPVDTEGNELPVVDESGEEVEFVDPVELLEDDRQDLQPEETWVNVTYATPDGGAITAWVNALYLAIRTPEGTAQRLADLPTIPGNRPGEAVDTEITPPAAAEDRVTVRITNLDTGTNLNLRRTPETGGEVLARLPNGTVTEFVGMGEPSGEWVFVRYAAPQGGTVSGWVSTRYIVYERNGRTTDLEELEARGLLEFVDEETQRGSISAGAPAVVQPTRDPTRDAFVAQVRTNVDTNLNLRRTPTDQGEVIARIPSGTSLIVEGRTEDGDWLRTSFEGVAGWVNSDFVTLTFNNATANVEDVPIFVIETEDDDDDTETEGGEAEDAETDDTNG